MEDNVEGLQNLSAALEEARSSLASVISNASNGCCSIEDGLMPTGSFQGVLSHCQGALSKMTDNVGNYSMAIKQLAMSVEKTDEAAGNALKG